MAGPVQLSAEAICALPPVRSRIEAFEAARGAARRDALLRLLAGVALATLAVWGVSGTDLWAMGWIVAVALLILAAIAAVRRLGRFNRDFAAAAAAAIGEAGGLRHQNGGFVPEGYDEARGYFFPFAPGARFADLFEVEIEGRHAAVCQAVLEWPKQALSGRLFLFERRSAGAGTLVALPDAGLFNRIQPAGGLPRAPFDDREFERRFEVFAANPHSAKLWLDAERRALLVRLWESGRTGRRGRVYAWLGERRALVFVGGEDLFPAESRFGGPGAEARVARMCGTLEGSLATLESLVVAFG